MTMASVLREKRKALGLTQEQVANALGVTAPAVNKWEKGSTCPDILLLPALARLLKTDPNALLGFQETPTQQEIARILTDIAQGARNGEVAQSFAAAQERLKEYPHSTELLQQTATILNGALLLSAMPAEEKEPYRRQILTMYERVAQSGDTKLANSANYLRASAMIRDERYAEAQELLDALPDWSALDKRGMQADVYDQQGETQKAAELLERKLTQNLMDQQATLCRLIRLYLREGNEAGAQALAECARSECKAFRLGDYWENIAPMELAVAHQDAQAATEALGALLGAAAKPWSAVFSPLFAHLPAPKPADATAMQFLAPLLQSLDDDPKFAFLAGYPGFQALLEKYRPMAAAKNERKG